MSPTMANLFPTTPYETGKQFEDEERQQWNTVLSFANYLFERDAGVDFRVAMGMLKQRGWLKSQMLDMIQLFSGLDFPEHMALAIKYQDELAQAFNSMLFDGFRQEPNRMVFLESILDELMSSAVQLNKVFTRFDAVCVFIRFALKFELQIFAPSLYYVSEPTLADTYMQPFIRAIKNTEAFNQKEKDSLAFLAQSISAFRMAPGFPCTCKYAKENNGSSIILTHQSERMNSWSAIEEAVMAVAAGEELSPSIGTDLTRIGPVLIAWLMYSPTKREMFVKWLCATKATGFNYVHRLFSEKECPNGASRLLTFIKANIEANEDKPKSKPLRNPLLDD